MLGTASHSTGRRWCRAAPPHRFRLFRRTHALSTLTRGSYDARSVTAGLALRRSGHATCTAPASPPAQAWTSDRKDGRFSRPRSLLVLLSPRLPSLREMLLLTALAWCGSAALASSIPPSASVRRLPPPPVVDLGYARYQGFFNDTTELYEWRGIRFATAARFQAPRTPKKTVAVQNATEYGPTCWQGTVGLKGTLGTLPHISTPGEQSEDCLFVNIQAPPRALKGGKLPVLVWIHGGGALRVFPSP